MPPQQPPAQVQDTLGSIAASRRRWLRAERRKLFAPLFQLEEATQKPSSSSSPDDILVIQPESRPISHEQLVAEAKGIYAGLVMVESKCIEVDNAQSSNTTSTDSSSKLNNEQWQALIALHRTLLHEHLDFFLASQHPSASSPALRRLASKYAMPARMWRHGIHSFLELLRHRLPLPGRREHMLTFIYLAYSMMALPYETVPAFEDTWIECLGDLGRYRMAIEEDNMKDREVWTSVCRHWYSKASDKSPTTGRLYHHLAILARPNALQQLFYYTKPLCAALPYISTRDSILNLFDPGPNRDRVHAILFKSFETRVELHKTVAAFISDLDALIARNSRRWLEPGMHIANSNCAAMLGYGDIENPITSIPHRNDTDEDEDSDFDMAYTSAVGCNTFTIAAQWIAQSTRAVWGTGLLKSRQSETRTCRKLALSVFLAHGIPLAAAALTFHPALRITSGVMASVSGVTVIPLRINGGFPAWSVILTYILWAAAFSAYLCLQTLRIPGELSHRRQLYLFCVIIAGLHLTIAISQGSDSIPDALTMYGPVLLTTSAFLMVVFLKAIHPGGPAAGAGGTETPPDGTALTLGAASLGFVGP